MALLRYGLNATDWADYIAARQSRILSQPGTLRKVKVEGGSSSAKDMVIADLQPLEGKPIAAATTLDALKPIQSNGGYQATYEVFASPAEAGSSAIRHTRHRRRMTSGILVRLSKDSIGPPYLIFGPEMTASTSNITRIGLNTRVVAQNLGGFGSELRGNVEVGYPHQCLRRVLPPADAWRILHRAARWRAARAGLHLGKSETHRRTIPAEPCRWALRSGVPSATPMQVSAEWRALDTRWAPRTGSGGGPYLTGTAQTGLLHFNIDKESSGTVSPSGYRLAASAGAFYHGVGSSNAPMVQVAFNRTFSFNPNNILGVSAVADSYLRANVAQPFRFTLGGPMRLSASSIDEYRGTDIYLARTGYMRRIAALPTGLGQGLYGLLGYEAGEVWSPEQRAVLRQDGTIGLVGNTPIGILTFGVSVGDAGHRKVFFTIGRWF